MTLGTRLAPQHNDGLQNILQRGKQTSSWGDDEIQERVKIPVDERLGGCRGFKSHRPLHHCHTHTKITNSFLDDHLMVGTHSKCPMLMISIYSLSSAGIGKYLQTIDRATLY